MTSPQSDTTSHTATGGSKSRLASILLSPAVVFLLLALAVMGPLLLPGHILTLDSPLAINWDVGGYFWGTSDGAASVFSATYNSAPIAFVLKALGFVIPPWLVEKMWLVLILWLCGVGASRLPYLRGIGRYYAGVFYMVNPFTYIRFVSGQWGLLGAYALAPFAITSMVRLLERPHRREAIRLVLVLTVIGFLQLHGLALVLIALACLYAAGAVMNRGAFRMSLPVVLLSAAFFLGVNLFWIVRYAMAGGGAAQNMPVEELSYFASYGPFQMLSLRGFWLSQGYVDIASIIPPWWLLFLPLLFLSVYGTVEMAGVSRQRWLALGLGGAAAFGLIFALGPAVPAVRPAFEYLWEHLPFYRAFRDSHKFVALLALGYAYFGAFALQSLTGMKERQTFRGRWLPRFAAGLAFLISFTYALPMFGTWGQLKTAQFPAEWQEVRSRLDADTGDYNVLVLPWHMYQDFSWLPNRWPRLANPALGFFSQPTISGDNLEIEGVPSDSSNPVSKYVEFLLKGAQSRKDFGKKIAILNARYVVLFKDGDYKTYDFLRQQTDLRLVFEGETIALFQNMDRTARAYAVKDVEQVNGLEDYLQVSADQNPLEHLYVLGSGGQALSSDASRSAPGAGEVATVSTSPVSYEVEKREGAYLVFTLPQHVQRDGWRYEDEPVATNLGMMPAFTPVAGGGQVVFWRFYTVYLPAYVLSLLTLVFMLAFCQKWKRP